MSKSVFVFFTVFFMGTNVSWAQTPYHITTSRDEFNRKYWEARDREINNRGSNTLGSSSGNTGLSWYAIGEKLKREELERAEKAAKINADLAYHERLKKLLIPKYDSFQIINKDNNLVLIEKNGRKGLYHDYMMKELIPPIYTHIDANGGVKGMRFVGVQKEAGGAWAVYDTWKMSKRELTEAKYHKVYNCGWIAAVAIGSKWGFVDAEGREISPIVYQDFMKIELLPIDPIPVKFNDKWGFIDVYSQKASPFSHDKILEYARGKAEVKEGNLTYVVDTEKLFDEPRQKNNINQSVLAKYDYLEISNLQANRRPARAKRNNKWGFIDREGNELSSFKYDELSPFSFYGESLYSQIKLNKKVGLLNQNFQEEIPPQYDDIKPFNNLLIVQLNGKEGLINQQGKTIIPIIYDKITHQIGNYVSVTKNGKTGLYNNTGSEMIKIQYDRIYYAFFNNRYEVKMDDKRGVVDSVGNEIIAIKYDDIKAVPYCGYRVELNGKWGILDTLGKEVIQPRYDELKVFYEKGNHPIFMAKLDKKQGIIDGLSGADIIPPKYDKCYNFSDNYHREYAEVYLDRKYGLVDRKGIEVIPPNYDAINSAMFKGFAKGPIAVKLKGKWGYVDGSGNVVIPFKYAEAGNFWDGSARVKIDHKSFYINTKGKKVKIK